MRGDKQPVTNKSQGKWHWPRVMATSSGVASPDFTGAMEPPDNFVL